MSEDKVVLNEMNGVFFNNYNGLKFHVQFEDIPIVTEVNEGEQLTESAGYRTAQQQIEEMLNAGQRLDAFRRGDAFYDYEDGYYDEDFEEDLPYTRMKGFEMSHASQMDMVLRDKFMDSLKEQESEPINELDVNRLTDTNKEPSGSEEVSQ